jgi:toxin ParE1/3/4
MRLNITDPADRDLEDILYYGLRKYGERQATAYIESLRENLRWIAEWPHTSRLYEDIRPPVRRHVHGAHNVIYRVTEDEVLIVRIFYHSADWKKLL